jgi:hypothetical protein
MILAQVIFLVHDINDVEVYLPQAPRKGETFVFPFVTTDVMDFKIIDIEWVFDEYNKFSKIRVYLEQD